MANAASDLTTATILFTDVVDSTTTRTGLGEELADRLFHRHARLLRDIVHAHRTVFVKSVGDGVMAVFSSATDGLRAVAAIQQAVATENGRTSTRLEVRGGVSSGDIRWTEDDVDGIPAIEAARLAAAAAGGQILCSELTARLACGREGLAFKELGRLELKGLSQPVLTLEMLWWQEATTHTPAPAWLDADDLLPLVGRSTELELVSQWMARTSDRPAIVLIEGDAGAGKTRLLSEVATRIVSRGHILVAGRCTDPPGGPMQPFAEAVTRLAVDSPTLLHDVLEHVDSSELGELARLAPVLSKAPFALAPAAVDDSESEFFRLVAALAGMVERLVKRAPVTLVVEDLHWATASTLRLLKGLLFRLEDAPVRVIATSRSTPLARHDDIPLLGELLMRSDVTRIVLPPLSADDITVALEASNRDGQVVIPLSDSARIAAISGGNAFLVTETIRELRSGRPVGATATSDAVRRFVSSRMERVTPVGREVVDITASSADIDLGVLRVALAVDESSFADAVDEALATGLLVADDGGLTMAHDLARGGVTGAIPPARAALLHRRIVGALMTIDPDVASTRPYLLADHVFAIAWLGAPDDVRLARDAARSAAAHASSRLAHHEAVSWIERSLQFHDRLHEKNATALRAELTLELGRAKWRAGDHDARNVLHGAGRAAVEADRRDLLVAAALEGSRGFFSVTAAADDRAIELLTSALAVTDPSDLATRAVLIAELAAELTWSRDGDRRFELSNEALELARRSGDEQALIRVLASRLLTVNAADTLDERIANSDELLDLAKRADDDLLRFHAVFQSTTPLLEIGAIGPVGNLVREAQQLAHAVGQPELRWLVEFSTAGFDLMRGDIASSEARATEALRIGVAAGRRREARAFFAEQLAEIRRLQGRLVELEASMAAAASHSVLDPVHSVLRYLCEVGAPGLNELFERAVAGGLPPRRDVAQRPALDNLILVAVHLGRADRLPVLYDALLPSAETFAHSAVAHMCGHHYLAVAAAALGEDDTADSHFSAARDVHQRARVPLLLAESLIEWLRLGARRPQDASRMAVIRDEAAAALSNRGAALLEDRLQEALR